MGTTLTIARREFVSYFLSPIGYVVLALFTFISALLFVLTAFLPGYPASMYEMFRWLVWVSVGIVPAISMRLISEELRSGNIEPLMSSPITDTNVVLGKWLGGLGFYAALLLPTLLYVALLMAWSRPDWGPLLTQYIGILLLGGFYMAIGAFASVLTRNQIIAYLISLFIILMIAALTYFVAGALPRAVYLLLYLNPHEQFDDFNKGLIDISNFVYFLSGIVLFLVAATKLLESRKWR